MSRFLFATWDGAGNLVPTLAVARRLARAGHDARVLGHRAIDRRLGAHGWRFRPFRRTIDVDSTAPADPGGGMLRPAQDLWVARSVAEDVQEELQREAADVLIADCMLFTAMSAGHAVRIPTIALFHAAFALFRRGPLVDLISSLLPQLNAVRAGLGLGSVERLSDVHDACAMSVVATPREFDPPVPLPPNVCFAGPLLDTPAPLAAGGSAGMHTGDRPLVLVSLSTSDQGQMPILQRLIGALSSLHVQAIVTTGPAVDPAALAPSAHVQVVRFVPHREILPHAALVITHAGLGTVMSSLAAGVPLLCIPFGRDQFYNASRVEALHVGAIAAREADDQTLRAHVERLLFDEDARVAAARFAAVIRGYDRGIAAVQAIEHLARRAPLALECAE